MQAETLSVLPPSHPLVWVRRPRLCSHYFFHFPPWKHVYYIAFVLVCLPSRLWSPKQNCLSSVFMSPLHSSGCRNTVTGHNHSCEDLFDMQFKAPLLTDAHMLFLLFGLLVHQNFSTFTWRWNKQKWNFGFTVYIGNFMFIWELYHISDKHTFPSCLGPMDISEMEWHA